MNSYKRAQLPLRCLSQEMLHLHEKHHPYDQMDECKQGNGCMHNEVIIDAQVHEIFSSSCSSSLAALRDQFAASTAASRTELRSSSGPHPLIDL